MDCKFTYGKSWRFVIGSQFSTLCLRTIIECAYCVAIMLICLNVLLIFTIGSLSIVYSFLIDGMCVVALAHVTNTMSGAMFHPFAMILLMSGWYFVVFLSRAFATICHYNM